MTLDLEASWLWYRTPILDILMHMSESLDPNGVVRPDIWISFSILKQNSFDVTNSKFTVAFGLIEKWICYLIMKRNHKNADCAKTTPRPQLFYCLVKRAFYDKWGLYTAMTPLLSREAP